MALKKKIRPGIREWDTKMLQVWMCQIGFEACKNIILYGRVTGTQMATAHYEWMRDTLGITDENECSKLKQEIDKVRTSCLQDCALFSWGNNKFGQCATAKAKFLSMPKKIDLPDHICLDETQKNVDSIKAQQTILIEKIFCSNKQSGFLLSNGEFWACGNCPDAGKEVIKATTGPNIDAEELKREQ